MKIRSDYVTNSSSSSFILSFKNEESVLKTLEEQFPKNVKPGWSAGEEGYLNQLIFERFESFRRRVGKLLTKSSICELSKLLPKRILGLMWE